MDFVCEGCDPKVEGERQSALSPAGGWTKLFLHHRPGCDRFTGTQVLFARDGEPYRDVTEAV